MMCLDCGRPLTRHSKSGRCHPCAQQRRWPPLADRFWASVDKRGADECWPWTRSCNRRGYGAAHDGRRRPDGSRRNFVAASRLAWELTHGPISAGLFVCHRCDNPPCCNPAHLYLGTPADNMRDAMERDRLWRGEQHHFARLTAAQVAIIRQRLAAGVLQRAIGTEFGVSQSAISCIARGITWADQEYDARAEL